MSLPWRRFSSAFVLRACAMAAAAGGQILLGRMLLHGAGDAGMASWTLLLGVGILLSMLDLGLGNAVVRQAADPVAEGEVWQAARSLAWWTGLTAALVLFTAGLVAPLRLGLVGGQADDCRVLALVLAAGSLLRYRLGLGVWQLYRRQDPRPSALVELASSALRPLAAAAALFLGWNLVATGAAWMGAELLVVLVAARVAGRLPAAPMAPGRRLRLLRDAAGIAGVSLVSSLPATLAAWLIGGLGRVEEVNRWQYSYALPLLGLRLAYLPQTIVFPSLVRALAEQSLGAWFRERHRVLAGYLALLLLGCAAIPILNGPFVAWWIAPEYFAGRTASIALATWVVLSVIRAGLWSLLAAGSACRLPVVGSHAVEVAILILLAGSCFSMGGLAGIATLLAGVQLLPLLANLYGLRRLGRIR